ncbi:MAG: ATP-dependent DNA helicase RecG, partial [Christensenellales bacterium]
IERDTQKRSLEPVYRASGSLSQSIIKAAMAQALKYKRLDKDNLPADFIEKHKLCDASFAYNNIHFPTDSEALELARRRIVFEEFLMFQIAAMYAGGRRRRFEGSISAHEAELSEFEGLLPFKLTTAQKTVIEEIYGDLSGGMAMNRLVQGDVGCGKTAVAMAAMYACAKSGYQCAFMAPTEILARQHFDTVCRTFPQFKAVLLVSGMTQPQRAQALNDIAGDADIVIGTHALIQQGIEFRRLGLAIADEQHRFGVRQRAELGAKGQSPHLLVMSATPIPRTLALMLYGDLDISVIEGMPPGRKRVKTHIVPEHKRQDMYCFIMDRIREGLQAYIVCPMIEKNDDFDMRSAEEVYDEVSGGALKEARVELLHGRLGVKQRQAAIDAFSRGEIDALVSTTVIEVGVDVPNACVMAVENADRFGLAQLHQLRGRVGRGKEQAYFFMAPQSDGEKTRERLNTLCATSDGFEIARKDLEMRGPGEFLGSRQHGDAGFKTGSLARDMEVLNEAREAAKEVLSQNRRGLIEAALEKYKNVFSAVSMN